MLVLPVWFCDWYESPALRVVCRPAGRCGQLCCHGCSSTSLHSLAFVLPLVVGGTVP